MRYGSVAPFSWSVAFTIVVACATAQMPDDGAKRYQLAGGAVRPAKPSKKFSLGVWAHSIGNFGESPEEVRRHVGRLAEAGFDLIIPCVKNPPGAVDFFTDAAEVNEAYPAWDPLKVLIQASRERGIKVHPWFCVFLEGEKSRLLGEHPEYGAKNEGNSRLHWTCAMRPEVQDYVYDLYVRLAERYRPDGLHLDYIRTGGPCKCDYCREQMAAEGVDVERAAWGTPPFERWTAWRTSRITDFVRRMREYTAAHDLELSAAVFRDYPQSVPSQGQDWVGWANEGLVDFVFPMNYDESEINVRRLTREHVKLVDDKVALWEGLMKDKLTPPQLARQVRAVLQLRTKGAVIFHYPALTDEDLAAMKGYLDSVGYLRR
jgi:uncharacterized lipoprotein YddW (UPF0748 family)